LCACVFFGRKRCCVRRCHAQHTHTRTRSALAALAHATSRQRTPPLQHTRTEKHGSLLAARRRSSSATAAAHQQLAGCRTPTNKKTQKRQLCTRAHTHMRARAD
jgi:hypothetical protein